MSNDDDSGDDADALTITRIPQPPIPSMPVRSHSFDIAIGAEKFYGTSGMLVVPSGGSVEAAVVAVRALGEPPPTFRLTLATNANPAKRGKTSDEGSIDLVLSSQEQKQSWSNLQHKYYFLIVQADLEGTAMIRVTGKFYLP